MKVRLKLFYRMVLIIISISALSFYLSRTIISKNFKKDSYKETFEYNSKQAERFASVLKTSLNYDFDKVRAIVKLIQANVKYDTGGNSLIVDKLFEQTLIENPDYISLWKRWETPFGSLQSSYKKEQVGVRKITDSLNIIGVNNDGFYGSLKESRKEHIENPEMFSKTGEKANMVLKTNIAIPLIIDNRFRGAVGVEVHLSKYTQIIDSLTKDHGFSFMLFSNNGSIIMHPNRRLIGKNIVAVDTALSNSKGLLERIQSGKNSNFTIKNSMGLDSIHYALSSFKIANTTTPWCVLVAAPLTSIDSQIESILSVVSMLSKYGILIILIVLIVFSYRLTRPLRRTTKVLQKLAAGDFNNVTKLAVKTSDETKEMADSTNTVIESLNQLTSFAENIGKGNFDYEFSKSSDDDLLGGAILEMRNSLAKARDEENQRLIDEENLNWASHGINIFNRVLRVDNQNLEELTYEIIENLTTYLGAHMGGIYVKNDENSKIFELTSHIGFSKEKYSRKIVKPGDTHVGLCILEKDTIFINDVPKDYSKVTSGLGSAVPSSILIVPLISNLNLVGVIELESLKEIQPHQISFVEKLAETIASTIATVKVNVRTAQLLDKSQKQAEELEQQEEEMRQNMEEMQATQEEADKQEQELEQLIKGFKSVLLICEYDYNGRITEVNANYLDILKQAKGQVVGKVHKSDVFMEEKEKEQHKVFWNELRSGIVKEQVEYYKSGKSDYWILENFIPIKSNHGIVQKVLCVGIDITAERKTESEIQRLKEEGIVNVEDFDLTIEDEEANSVDVNAKLKIIDLSYLKMLYKGDGKKIYNILNLYSNTLPAQIIELDDILKARNYDLLKSRINGLKTKMSYLGLKKVYENFRSIEKCITEKKNMNKIQGLLNNIKKTWNAAIKELDLLLN